ncbi:beta-lactamase/transpeptidase-like protein [Artomyces pyxidatus]|uniref:Beta-lactamase/transpeptidase-like protein n=1 Tax=Artomyces pyxidatus TaxID=48021 RepID=A0ACB8SR75_9AGAM|nr:beta-lactamase/transpeptidase-like protein [Artomyces pyxidatus]
MSCLHARGSSQVELVSRGRVDRFNVELSRIGRAQQDRSSLPGLTLAIVHLGGTTELKAWGKKSEDGDKMTTDTVFNIGSCSKAFVSATIGILIDDYAHGRNTTPLPAGLHKFDWDTKIQDLLPNEWKLMDPWASEKANVKDTLSHVSGLPRHENAYKPRDTPIMVTKRLRDLRPAFELREQWLYNNQIYIVATHLVSTYTGSFARFVEDRIFKPLNMSQTTYFTNTAHASGKATQTWTSFNLVAGPMGVISGVEDLNKWVRMLLSYGVDPDTNQTIIPPSAFDTITSGRAVSDGNPSSQSGFSIVGYGLGWDRTSYLGHDIIEHGGGLPGATALIIGALSDGVGLVVLANADEKSVATLTIAIAVARKMFGIHDSALARDRISDRIDESPPLTSSDIGRPPYTYTGTYINHGYGTMVLCDASSTSQYCIDILSAYGLVDGVPPSTSHGELFTGLDTAWTSHARLAPIKDNEFIMRSTFLFPTGYGRNGTPFQTIVKRTMKATFVVEDGVVAGLGLSGSVSQGPTMREKEGGSVEYVSDDWFDKIS